MKIALIAKDIIEWIKSVLAKAGLSQSVLDAIEPVLYLLIIALVAFVVAEVAYRIAQFTLWRIQKMREYTFLTKLNEHNV